VHNSGLPPHARYRRLALYRRRNRSAPQRRAVRPNAAHPNPPALRGQAPSDVVEAVTTEVEQFAATGLVDDLCVLAARIHEG
jgi:hypothetical protein